MSASLSKQDKADFTLLFSCLWHSACNPPTANPRTLDFLYHLVRGNLDAIDDKLKWLFWLTINKHYVAQHDQALAQSVLALFGAHLNAQTHHAKARAARHVAAERARGAFRGENALRRIERWEREKQRTLTPQSQKSDISNCAHAIGKAEITVKDALYRRARKP